MPTTTSSGTVTSPDFGIGVDAGGLGHVGGMPIVAGGGVVVTIPYPSGSLIGQYATANFAMGDDGRGGTVVHEIVKLVSAEPNVLLTNTTSS